jgi:3-phosphoshikimate 1-carboxyvinyltransferase
MLASMGAPIERRQDDEGITVSLGPTDALAPLSLRVPGDFSSAAFFLALGALRGRVRVHGTGLNPTRTGMLDVLRRMGVGVRVVGDDGAAGTAVGEPVGDVEVGRADLEGTTVASREIPMLLDEVPALAALAAMAAGETRFEGVEELRVKESDRVRAMVENLRALGVAADAGPGHLVVRGTDRALRGTVDAHGDHRIAMAFGVLAALPGNEIEIRGRETVGISYPDFWSELERVNKELEAQ